MNRIIQSIFEKYPDGFTASESTNILIDIMKMVNEFQDMIGLEKKQFVLKLLKAIIEQTDSGPYDKEIDVILNTVIPPLIDNLISVDNGVIQINPKTKTALKVFCTSCAPCCMKK